MTCLYYIFTLVITARNFLHMLCSFREMGMYHILQGNPQRMKVTPSEEGPGECGGKKIQFLPVLMLYLANQHKPPNQSGMKFCTEDTDLSSLHWTTKLDKLGRFTASRHIHKSVIFCHETLNRNIPTFCLWTPFKPSAKIHNDFVCTECRSITFVKN